MQLIASASDTVIGGKGITPKTDKREVVATPSNVIEGVFHSTWDACKNTDRCASVRPSFRFHKEDFILGDWPIDVAGQHVLSAFRWCEDKLQGDAREELIDVAMTYGLRRDVFDRWLQLHGYTSHEAMLRRISYYRDELLHSSNEASEMKLRERPPHQRLWDLACQCQWAEPYSPRPKPEKKITESARALREPTPKISRLKSIDDIENMAHAPWLIRDLIPSRGIVLLYGPSGSGKSFLVLDLIFALTLGHDWFGHKVKATVASIYISLEGKSGLAYRYRALRERRGDPKERLKFVVDDVIDLRKPNDILQLADEIVSEFGQGAVDLRRNFVASQAVSLASIL
ncbi:AAA family ATPase, partial [Burkholderia anthina]|uniref:AAA family ATPase n=1 Tax=Burkholderia anthina TaxID=179879 RepID=UPI0033418100